MILELIPISTLLAVLTTQVLEAAIAAQDVLIEKETFGQLSKYLKDIQPVLTELQMRSIKDSSAAREALKSLQEDLRRANNLIELCKSRSRFYLLINCRRVIKDAQQVTRDIGKSLALLSLANAEVSTEIWENAEKLKDEMIHAKFEASESKLRIVDKLQMGIWEQRTDQGFANDLILDIARALDIPVDASDEIQKELASFKREKEEAADRKEKEEEVFMGQVIALLSQADSAHTPEMIQEDYEELLVLVETELIDDDDESLKPLMSLICPLKKGVMSDPMTVAATGQTYEREYIEEWFQCGNKTDPKTGQVLSDFTLRPNIPIRSAIIEWQERNHIACFQKARRMVQSGDELKQKQGSDELCALVRKVPKIKHLNAVRDLVPNIAGMLTSRNKEMKCKSLATLLALVADNPANKKARRMVQSGDELKQKQGSDELCALVRKVPKIKHLNAVRDLVPNIAGMLTSRNKEMKCKSLATLLALVADNPANKEKLIETGGVEQVIRCLSQNQSVSRLAVTLLLELLQTGSTAARNHSVYYKLSNTKSAILLLVTLLNSKDVEAAGKANLILNELSDCDESIIEMARVNWHTPLINRLCQGTDESQLAMAKAIAKMELTDQNKQTLGKGGAIPPLVAMASGKLEAKKAAFGSLRNLASFSLNKCLMAEAGVVSIAFNHVTSRRYPLELRELAAAVLEKIADQDALKFLVDSKGKPLDVDWMVNGLLAVLEDESSIVIRAHLLRLLLEIVSSLSSSFSIPDSMITTDTLSMLVLLLEGASDRESRDGAIHLLCSLLGYTKDSRVSACFSQKVLRILVRILWDDTNKDVQASAAGIMSSLPLSNYSVDDENELSNALMHALHTGNSKAKENATGALLTLSQFSSDKIAMQRRLVEAGIFQLLLHILESGSERGKTRAAHILKELSESTMHLSSPPPMPMGCLFFRSSPLPVCKVHFGRCSEKNTFCLVEARAIVGLVSLLSKPGCGEAAGAGLDALSTLIGDDSILEKGAMFLHGAEAIGPIIDLISHGTETEKEKVVLFLDRIFKVRQMIELYGGHARMPLVDVATHGSSSTRKKASKVLAKLEELHGISSYF